MKYSFEINNFASLSIIELFSILEIIILNRKISGSGTTHLCFALFDRLLLSKLNDHSNSKDIGYNQLKTLMKYIKKVILEKRFSRNLFVDLLRDKYAAEIPFEVLWWLDENHILHLEQQCESTNSSVILHQLICMLTNNSDTENDESHDPKNIACHFLFKIITYNYTNTLLKNSSNLNSTWNDTCFVIFNEFIHECLRSFRENINNNILVTCIKFVQKRQCFNSKQPSIVIKMFVHSSLEIAESILKYFYRNILNKFLFSDDNKADVYDAYVMQEMWSTNSLHENTIFIFHEIVKWFDLIEINNCFVGKINWQYGLILISVYTSKMPNSQQQLKKLVENVIQKGLNDRNVACMRNAFLVQRQICVEEESGQVARSYSEWYASTFGMNSNLKTSSDKHVFSFFLHFMHTFINYEPEYALKTHIERSLRIPPNCQHEMLNFKDLCRIQLARIQQSPLIHIYTNVHIPVICILELIIQCQHLAWVLKQTNIVPEILPYFIADTKFRRIKDAMVSNSFLSQAQISNCIPIAYEIMETPHFNNDSEEMFE